MSDDKHERVAGDVAAMFMRLPYDPEMTATDLTDAIAEILRREYGGTTSLLNHLEPLSVEQDRQLASLKAKLAKAREVLERIERPRDGTVTVGDLRREALACLKDIGESDGE